MPPIPIPIPIPVLFQLRQLESSVKGLENKMEGCPSSSEPVNQPVRRHAQKASGSAKLPWGAGRPAGMQKPRLDPVEFFRGTTKSTPGAGVYPPHIKDAV
ncbi:hypothetical protein MPTK1_3g24960 [Marchantia polymorpha subsp. ruderalis]|uniref:Uncharacterized protein n=2 Tax=Marchantia polymorpha TaxID=3197 RepID=A0AAF6B4I3_MARPO|nr:hypothetical protein MARPO_0100s0009 [Marchantia polymorpha]BBN06917.1 hypothetical protein Mp_3g24960 [Marchantia polymorpha subsp. ruderalis]|eukprot:PTQ32294.1 hypothetical protein MARPO_0100s0009 [Marchantia polymorpha]